MFGHGFSTFFAAQGQALDCTAHSHHPWPDVAAAAPYASLGARFIEALAQALRA
jgi:hypothetical protein